jgi:hypothetical protein
MFWASTLCFVVDILAILAWKLFGLLFEKLGIFSNLLVTLPVSIDGKLQKKFKLSLEQ